MWSVRGFLSLAYEDIGVLRIFEKRLEFQGKRFALTIEAPYLVEFGKSGSDIINSWAKVRDSRGDLVAQFAGEDWPGIFGRTRKIYRAMSGSS